MECFSGPEFMIDQASSNGNASAGAFHCQVPLSVKLSMNQITPRLKQTQPTPASTRNPMQAQDRQARRAHEP